MKVDVHDLVKLSDEAREELVTVALAEGHDWVAKSLDEIPWVAVTRIQDQASRLRVGIRGFNRAQRWAGYVNRAELVTSISPKKALQVAFDARFENLPQITQALRILEKDVSRIQNILGETIEIGLGGSIAFQAVTGFSTAHRHSDIDVILRTESLPAWTLIQQLVDVFEEFSEKTSNRIDAILETVDGGILMSELVQRPARVVIRTGNGPQLRELSELSNFMMSRVKGEHID